MGTQIGNVAKQGNTGAQGIGVLGATAQSPGAVVKDNGRYSIRLLI